MVSAPTDTGPGTRPGPSLVQPALRDARHFGYEAALRDLLAGIDVSRSITYRVHPGAADAPATPHADALPFLARQFSVWGLDGWSLVTTDAERRQLLLDAIPLHRTKGTPAGVEAALARIGFPSARVEERVSSTVPLLADGTAAGDGYYRAAGLLYQSDRAWALFRVSFNRGDWVASTHGLADLRAVIASYQRAACHLTDLTVRLGPVSDAITATILTPPQVAAVVTASERWSSALRADGAARAGGWRRIRANGEFQASGVRVANGGGVVEGGQIETAHHSLYPETRRLDAGLILLDPAWVAGFADGHCRATGEACADGRARIGRQGGLFLRQTVEAQIGWPGWTGGPTPSGPGLLPALTGGLVGGPPATAAVTGGTC